MEELKKALHALIDRINDEQTLKRVLAILNRAYNKK